MAILGGVSADAAAADAFAAPQRRAPRAAVRRGVLSNRMVGSVQDKGGGGGLVEKVMIDSRNKIDKRPDMLTVSLKGFLKIGRVSRPEVLLLKLELHLLYALLYTLNSKQQKAASAQNHLRLF